MTLWWVFRAIDLNVLKKFKATPTPSLFYTLVAQSLSLKEQQQCFCQVSFWKYTNLPHNLAVHVPLVFCSLSPKGTVMQFGSSWKLILILVCRWMCTHSHFCGWGIVCVRIYLQAHGHVYCKCPHLLLHLKPLLASYSTPIRFDNGSKRETKCQKHFSHHTFCSVKSLDPLL